VLKQPQFEPQPVERQVVAIYAVTGGYMDDYPAEDAKRFVEGFLIYLETRNPEVLSTIRDTGDMPEATEEALKGALTAFQETFVPTGAAPGSEAGIGRSTPPDEVKPDVGWDRMSSADDDDGAVDESLEERVEDVEQGGPVGQAEAPERP
jgi:hypothetical protein